MERSIVNTEPIYEVTPQVIETLKDRAHSLPDKSFRVCLHHSIDHPVQEMVIAMSKDTYWRAHRHPSGQSESYAVIEGAMRVFFFDDQGTIIRTVDMGTPNSAKTFLYRLSAPIWHMPICLSDESVYHEVREGPYDKLRDVEYAPWSPVENDTQACAKFLARLKAG